MTSHTPAPVPLVKGRDRLELGGAALLLSMAGVALFQLFGNANRGYIDTASLFYWWGFQWSNPGSDTEHGWLILGISGWLFWRNLKRASVEPTSTGESGVENRTIAGFEFRPAAAALVGGLVLHALGFAAQQARVSILALLLFTWGLSRLAGGRRWGAAAAFPLAFMLFAIPISALDSIGFWLRVWVVNASGAIAHLFGIGVLQSGTQLVAPDNAYIYDVAAACSGIRSLTAMTALSLLAGYLNFHSWWRRAAVLLLCFPLVYVGNVARIVAIIVAAQVAGPRGGDIAHAVMGYGVFVIVLGGVLGGVALLRRWRPEPASAPGPAGRAADGGTLPPARRPAWLAAGAVMVFAVAEMVLLNHLAHLPPRGRTGIALANDGRDPIELPAFIGSEWIGRREQVSVVEREILPADTGFSRKTYVALADPRQRVFLSLVLSGRDRTSIHRPELCLVGQGWTVTESASHQFRFSGAPKGGFDATLLRVRREVQVPGGLGRSGGKRVVPQLVAYWFVSGDQVVATHWQRLMLDSWNRVAHARADRWAYVLMQTDASDGESAALARMQAVLDGTLPAFQTVSKGQAASLGD
jgi:EpsI family protein